MNRRIGNRRRGREGFTLIELLAAMGILVLLVMFMANLFTQSTTVWDRGMHRTEINTAARAALNLMLREISLAVVGEGVPLLVDDDMIYFVSGVGNPPRNRRSILEIGYFVDNTRGLDSPEPLANRFSLYRAANGLSDSDILGVFGESPWWNSAFWGGTGNLGQWRPGDAPIIDNVYSVEFTYWHFDNNAPDGLMVMNTAQNDAPLPEVIEITLKLVSERAAERWAVANIEPGDEDIYTFNVQVYIRAGHSVR